MARVLAALLLLSLIAAPASADSTRDGNQGRGHEGDGSQGHDDDQEVGGRDDRNESVALDVHQTDDANVLHWDFKGNFRHTKEFTVYRAVDGGADEVLAKVSRHARDFNDTDVESGLLYTYYVVVEHTDGSTGAQSNSQTTAQCQWLSVSPKGNPPVLFHPECAPAGDSIGDLPVKVLHTG